MLKKVATLAVLVAVLAGCGETTKVEKVVTLDVRDLPPAMQTQNPVGVLRVAKGDKYHLCTASIVDRKYIFTAGHCVIHNGRQDSAGQMKLYFQNFRDSSHTVVQVTAVVRAIYEPLRRDWAVLQVADPATLSTQFGSFSLPDRNFPALAVAHTDAIVFDPAEDAYHFVLRVLSGRTIQGLISELIANYDVVSGNSGAPVLSGNRILGVVARGGGVGGIFRTQATELFPEIARVGLP